ncbi:hypothetical protein MKW94_024959 [Papaver nudicaule]|uniref:Thioesterase domain-containing protein n=1 Tax=Papaver nudicaule TaxID=74823 RepID=A0AA41RPW3_PAPNU|nr:hypothetical protein [Papaver nudicaule]
MASPSRTASHTGENHSRNSIESTVYGFIQRAGAFEKAPEGYETKNLISEMMKDLLKVDRIERGRIICCLTVVTRVTNPYGTLHGGVVATVAKLVAVACARTVVKEDKELRLGEMSISYLSAASVNVELEIDGRIVRSGRNVTTVSVEFRVKGTKKLVYTAHATFFAEPVPKL